MFLEQGFNRTKLSDVAEQLNITKPALYHYFASKEAILIECFRMGQELIEAHLAEIEASDGSGLDKVREFIRVYAAKIMTADFGMCLVRLDDRELSEEARRKFRKGKRLVDQRVRALIAEGIADGSIATCDPKMAAFAIEGSLNWIAHWYQPRGPLQATVVAETFASLLTKGLAVRQERASPAGA